MKMMLKDIFTSKKVMMALAGGITALIARFGFDAPSEMVMSILAFVSVLIFGQAKADEGKEAAKIEAASIED